MMKTSTDEKREVGFDIGKSGHPMPKVLAKRWGASC